MQIRLLTLQHFGKFHEKNIELEPGLNILYGENEAGKSTIHTFIRAMLFGQNGADEAETDRYQKYEPWEGGAQYAGSMELETGGKWYRLERDFRKESASFRVTDLETGAQLAENEIAALYTELEENSYMNTVSVGQLCSETDASLAVALREYAAELYNQKNVELKLQETFDRLQQQKAEQEEILKKLDQETLERQLAENEQACRETGEMISQLEAESFEKDRERTQTVQDLEGIQQVEQVQTDQAAKMQAMLQLAQEKQERLEKESEALKQKADRLAKELEQSAEKLEKKGIVNELDLTNKRNQLNKKLPIPWVLVILFVIAAAISIYNFIGTKRTYAIQSTTVTVILLAAAIAGFFIKKTYRDRDLDGLKAADALMQERKQCSERLEKTSEELTGIAKELEAVKKEQQELTGMEIDAQIVAKVQEKNQAIVSLSVEIQNLHWKVEQQKIRLTELENEKQQIRDWQKQRSAALDEIAALEMELFNTQRVMDEVRAEFGLRFNARASEYFARITQNKYKELFIDRDLNIQVPIRGKKVDAARLSRGTIEQIYLSLRLAAADVLYSEKQPLLLDDTFAHYDNVRLGNTLTALAGAEGQLLIFTCHTREKVIADREQIPYHLVVLS